MVLKIHLFLTGLFKPTSLQYLKKDLHKKWDFLKVLIAVELMKNLLEAQVLGRVIFQIRRNNMNLQHMIK